MWKVMKILFLNPQIDAGHNISKDLQEKGIALLFPADETEAWQMLRWHGSSVDLAIIHREGKTPSRDSGLRLVSKIKADPGQADLPIVLVTDAWSDEECARHQETSEGVNAYLHSPLTTASLVEVIEAILGQSFGAVESRPAPSPAQPPKTETHWEAEKRDPGIPVLEEASEIFLQNEASAPSDVSIQLEAPKDESPNLSLETFSSQTPGSSTPELIQTSGPEVETIPTAIGIQTEPSQAAPQIQEISMGLEITSSSGDKSGGLQLSLGGSSDSEPSSGEVPALELGNSISQENIPSSEEPAEVQAEPSGEIVDPEVEQEMPYLFGGSQKSQKERLDPAYLFAQPQGDAVVPGGAAQAPDLETFKKYLLLREQDVAVLSNKLKASQDQIAMFEQMLREEKAKNAELTHVANEQKRKIDEFEREKTTLAESLQTEISELRFQVKAKTDKAKVLELQSKELTEELGHLKERVRSDIRKIRVREKELENRLEIMKKDSEALIGARENKIIELKRKLDLLEFNMDLLQDQHTREKENSVRLRERLTKAAQVVRVAGGLLDSQKAAGGKDVPVLDNQNIDSDQEDQKAS